MSTQTLPNCKYVPTLSHPQRQERRMRVAEAIKSGKTLEEAMHEFGVSEAIARSSVKEFIHHRVKFQSKTKADIKKRNQDAADMIRAGSTIDEAIKITKAKEPPVRKLCHQQGIIIPRRVSTPRTRESQDARSKLKRADIAALDWTRTDAEISRRYGVSRERVRQIRQRDGKGAPEHKWRESGVSMDLRDWLKMNRSKIIGMNYHEVVDMYGIPIGRSTMMKVLREFGIETKPQRKMRDSLTRDNFHTLCVRKSVREGMTDCWEIPGSAQGAGYPKIGADYAYRIAWELFHGDRPGDKTIYHKCRNSQCVNPAHLAAGSWDELHEEQNRHAGHRNHTPLGLDAAREIRRRNREGESIGHLAVEYKKKPISIWKIVSGQSYREAAEVK